MLTDTEIKQTPTPEAVKKMADGGGLYIELSPAGTRTWRWAFRHCGKQKTLTIGAYPKVTLAQARKARDLARERLKDGVDPVIERQQQRERAMAAAGTTFEDIGREWQNKRKQEDLSDSAYRKDKQLLDHHAYPAIGPRPINTITPPEILTLLRRVEVRGHVHTAKRLRSTLSRVFRYGVATGRCDRDPAADLVGALVTKKTVHHPALFDPKEIGALVRAMDGYEGKLVRLAMLIQLHTFVRPGELRKAMWSEFDLDTAIWRISGARMKMRRDHIVPLSPQVVTMLRELQELSGYGHWLFPSMLGSKICMSDATVNAALRRLGYGRDRVVGHGFRRTASTILNESGLWSVDSVELQLAHVDGSVRGIYNAALRLDERTKMMSWYSDWLNEQAAKV
jgi:integrase